jgi:hypothetical protein
MPDDQSRKRRKNRLLIRSAMFIAEVKVDLRNLFVLGIMLEKERVQLEKVLSRRRLGAHEFYETQTLLSVISHETERLGDRVTEMAATVSQIMNKKRSA